MESQENIINPETNPTTNISSEASGSVAVPTISNNTPQDMEMTIVRMAKDVENLKKKVVELESEKLAKYFNMTPAEAKDKFVIKPLSRLNRGYGRRPLLESEILDAQRHCDNCAQAVARHLGVNYKTYYKYAKRYGIHKTNPGSPMARKKGCYSVEGGKYPLSKILSGEIYHPEPKRLKKLLFRGGQKQPACERCGWKEKRIDGIPPLLINFLDGDQTHQTLDNIKIYCYNCTFVLRGYVRRGIVIFKNDDDLPPNPNIYVDK